MFKKDKHYNGAISKVPGYKISINGIDYYIYISKYPIEMLDINVFFLGNVRDMHHTFVCCEADNSIYMVYMLDPSDSDLSRSYHWAKLMSGTELDLLQYLFPINSLNAEYSDNSYVNINKLLQSCPDDVLRDEVTSIINQLDPEYKVVLHKYHVDT